MKVVTFEGREIKKTFDRRIIFDRITFTLKPQQCLGIVGRNGSGKSTLTKILTGILSPTAGDIRLLKDSIEINKESLFQFIGFVAPYLQIYDEFSAWENLDFFRRIRGLSIPDSFLTELLQRVNLSDRKDSMVRTYSSGMKQRLKFAFALLHSPAILVLDEPTSNLDAEGIRLAHDIMKEQKEKGILIVATNEDRDLLYCDSTIDLNIFSGQQISA